MNKSIKFKDCAVYYNGKLIYYINLKLLNKQGVTKRINKIKETHILKLTFMDMMKHTDNRLELRSLANDITECEFELQKLWKFDADAKYHRWWNIPKCECPKIDNNTMFKTGFGIVNQNCLIHGV